MLEHANLICLRCKWTISVPCVSLVCAAVSNGCPVHGPKLELVKVKYNEHITDLGFSRARVLFSKLALISPYCFNIRMHVQNPFLRGMVWPGGLHHGYGGSTFLCWSFSLPFARLLIHALQSPACPWSVSSSSSRLKKVGEAANPQTLTENLPIFFFF